MNLPPALMMEIEKMAAASPEQRLIDGERKAGFDVFRPGEVDWLPTASWLPSTIVSTDGKRVRLIALMARNPGGGAFLKLVITIMVMGMAPVVVEPGDAMVTTLTRWGWKSRRIGKGFSSQEIWYPARVLIKRRKVRMAAESSRGLSARPRG